MRAFLVAAALLLAAGMPGSGRAAEINVVPNGDNNCGIGSCNFQAALDFAILTTSEDTINVASGDYNIGTTLIFLPLSGAPSALNIEGPTDGEAVLIGPGSEGLLRINTAGLPADRTVNISIRGLTFLSGSTASNGGGLFVNTNTANITILNSQFGSNNASIGGGAYLETTSGSITLVNNIFNDNTSSRNGGGATVRTQNGVVTITNNTFSTNSSSLEGGGLFVFFSDNTARGNLFNNIIWNNTAPSGNDLFVNDDGNSDDSGVIVDFFHNDVLDFIFDCEDRSPLCSEAVNRDNTNIDANPLLTADFHLNTGSPAIDAGDDAAPNRPLTDIDGDARPLDGDGVSGAVTDIGADEFDPANPPDGVPPPPPGDGGESACFVSTAAFGSSLAGEVEVLRRFRDKHLLTSPPGRALVRLYYRHSPPLARCLAAHGVLRAAARMALAPVVYGVRHPGFALMSACLLAGAAVLGRKRKKQALPVKRQGHERIL